MYVLISVVGLSFTFRCRQILLHNITVFVNGNHTGWANGVAACLSAGTATAAPVAYYRAYRLQCALRSAVSERRQRDDVHIGTLTKPVSESRRRCGFHCSVRRLRYSGRSARAGIDESRWIIVRCVVFLTANTGEQWTTPSAGKFIVSHHFSSDFVCFVCNSADKLRNTRTCSAVVRWRSLSALLPPHGWWIVIIAKVIILDDSPTNQLVSQFAD